MGLLGKLFKKASGLLMDKPKVEVDYFGLEHFLLYHGLMGNSPENRREFKDVRADIISAISRKNSANLCANLKLEPLRWEEKLQRIFDEAIDISGKDLVYATLLPARTNELDESGYVPLAHQDWQVKANAAGIIAHLRPPGAEEALIAALDATADDTAPSFLHISRACGTFYTPAMIEALSKQLQHTEPWTRVDAAAALSRFEIDESFAAVQKAFAYHHDFLDYAAMAAARNNYSPRDLLKSAQTTHRELGAQILLNIVEASKDTFAGYPDLVLETGIYQCLRPLTRALADSGNEPRAVVYRALMSLCEWCATNQQYLDDCVVDPPAPEHLDAALALLRDKRAAMIAGLKSMLPEVVAQQRATTSDGSARMISNDQRHAVLLAGALAEPTFVDHLIEIIDMSASDQEASLLFEAVQSLGQIAADKEFAAQNPDFLHAPSARLIALSHRLVDPAMRSKLPQQASPITEKNPYAAKVYWQILQTLGHFPTKDALNMLVLACQDTASDKREAALASAIALFERTRGEMAGSQEVRKAIEDGLADPSNQVKLQAIAGAGRIGGPECPYVAPLGKLIFAQEVSISKAAFTALGQLSQSGNKTQVVQILTEARKNIHLQTKIARIDEILGVLDLGASAQNKTGDPGDHG